MAMQIAPARNIFPLPSDHVEQLSRAASVLTVDPFKNTLFYFFPLVGAFFNSYQELRNDPAQEAMMPQRSTVRILEEVENLTNCAGIQRKITPYIALNYAFASCGGTYSITQPALFLPEQHLYRREGLSSFGQERLDENLRQKQWIYSDDETRFCIARELGQLKENSILIKIAIKVSVIASLFIIYATPFGWPLGISLFIGAIGLYIVSERSFHGRADRVGSEILGIRLNDPKRAVQIAIDTLEKQKQQNLYRRENTRLGKYYITASGNNTLDFIHPFLTSRIEALRTIG